MKMCRFALSTALWHLESGEVLAVALAPAVSIGSLCKLL